MKKSALIFLASKSERRKELLREHGINFKLAHSEFEEKVFRGNPRKTVRFNAVGKARNARINSTSGVILGADTLVALGKKLFGKPSNKSHAVRMLKMLSGTNHQVYTGVALLSIRTGKLRSFVVRSDVKMRPFPDSQIKKYFKKVNPLDKAGAYAIQECGDQLIEKIIGSYSNVVGLPMERLTKILSSM